MTRVEIRLKQDGWAGRLDDLCWQISSGWRNNLLDLTEGETRGPGKVPDRDKSLKRVLGQARKWVSESMVVATFAVGALSYTVFSLDFGTSVLVIFFFSLLGIIPVGFFALKGARSGLYQPFLVGYLLGNVGKRIFALLNALAKVAWTAVNIMASAQLLCLVSHQRLPHWAGCLVLAALAIIVTFISHTHFTWTVLPNIVVFISIIVRLAVAQVFQNSAMNESGYWVTWGSGETFAGNVLSYGSIVFGLAVFWTSRAANYTVFLHSRCPSARILIAPFCLWLSFLFTLILGAAAATGLKTTSEWEYLYQEFSIGGLVYAILVRDSLHGFGEFLCVILALFSVYSTIPVVYSIPLDLKAVWSNFEYFRRFVLIDVSFALTLAIAIPAFDSFDNTLRSSLNMMSYFLAVYSVISAVENHFHPARRAWNSRINPGVASTFAFCCGIAGVVIGMDQNCYCGVIARQIGSQGGDIGFELCAGFALLGYVIARPFESRVELNNRRRR